MKTTCPHPALSFGGWIAFLALSFASPFAANAGSGALVIIGGALSSDNEAVYRAVLERRLPGRPICVLPTASSRPRRSMAAYVEDFRRYGGPRTARGVEITTKKPRSASRPAVATRLDACGGFFFTGGDQSRIVDVLRPGGEPTPADTAIRGVWRAGGVVAGTSAGAAMMSDPMIGGGSSAKAFEHGVVSREDEPGLWIRDGMGFTREALMDQHCLARGRLGRLLVAVAALAEYRRGYCIDEDTALVVEDGEAAVIGSSGVAVLELESRSRDGAESGRLWLLGAGDRFRSEAGTAEAGDGKAPWGASSPPPRLLDPWGDDTFHRFLILLAGSSLDAAAVGSNASRLELQKADAFRALSRDPRAADSSPRALFAGPFEITWRPVVDRGQ